MTQLLNRLSELALALKFGAGNLLQREEGQDAMEYAVVAVIVVAVVAGLGSVFGGAISTAITTAFGKIDTLITAV